jgi:ATP-dependent DNA ligase
MRPVDASLNDACRIAVNIAKLPELLHLIRRHGALASAVLCAFDLLDLGGKDLCREPIERHKTLLAKLLRGSHLSIWTARLSIARRWGRAPPPSE